MKLARLVLPALLVMLAAAGSVAAHSGVQSYVYVSVFDDGLEGRVEYPIVDLADALDIDLPDDPSTIENLSSETRNTIVDYTRAHLEMGDDDGPWELRYDGTISYLPTGSVGYVLVHFDVVRDFDEVPRRWTVTYDGVIESNPERDALFLIEDDWRSATFRNEDEHLLGFSIGNETQVIELESASAVDSLREIARRGTVSVDRSALVLVAVLTVLVAAVSTVGSRRDRDPDPHRDTEPGAVPKWRTTLVEVAGRIGIVILGQVASLWAIGLTGADVGTRLVMLAGALGVLLAAATWWLRGPTVRAAMFAVGLLSGVGVGATFVDQQLDRSLPIRTLVAFGLGAALMVGVVVVLLLPLVLVVRWTRTSSTFGAVVVAVGAAAGLVWLIESSFGFRFRLRTAELRFADAVTSPLIVGVVTVVAALALFLRRSKRPVDPSAVDTDSQPDPIESIEV